MRKNQLGKKEGRKRKNEREIEKYAGGGEFNLLEKSYSPAQRTFFEVFFKFEYLVIEP